MTPIDLGLSDSIFVLAVRGCIYEEMDEECLTEDLLEVDLRTGKTIEVGWVPDGDPSGHFRIIIFQDYWTNQIGSPIYSDDPVQAVKWIRYLTGLHGDNSFTCLDSDKFPDEGLIYDPNPQTNRDTVEA